MGTNDAHSNLVEAARAGAEESSSSACNRRPAAVTSCRTRDSSNAESRKHEASVCGRRCTRLHCEREIHDAFHLIRRHKVTFMLAIERGNLAQLQRLLKSGIHDQKARGAATAAAAAAAVAAAAQQRSQRSLRATHSLGVRAACPVIVEAHVACVRHKRSHGASRAAAELHRLRNCDLREQLSWNSPVLNLTDNQPEFSEELDRASSRQKLASDHHAVTEVCERRAALDAPLQPNPERSLRRLSRVNKGLLPDGTPESTRSKGAQRRGTLHNARRAVVLVHALHQRMRVAPLEREGAYPCAMHLLASACRLDAHSRHGEPAHISDALC
mmetsp:Transcript_22270/g.72182  ORF Transcript_22270/g.72182 Transcript_22270/m.72182 type:complete len:328 (-) Transcript_22270:1747-2730(-)